MDILEYDPESVRVQSHFHIDTISFNQTMKRFKEVFGNDYKIEYKFNPFTNRITIYCSFVVDRTKLEQTMKNFRDILGDSCDFECSLNYIVKSLDPF